MDSYPMYSIVLFKTLTCLIIKVYSWGSCISFLLVFHFFMVFCYKPIFTTYLLCPFRVVHSMVDGQ